MTIINDIKKLHVKIRPKIRSRLSEFDSIWENSQNEKIFHEMVFCLLTPQSNAKSCWSAVEGLKSKNLLYKADAPLLAKNLNKARFKNNKARYICEARSKFVKGKKIGLKPCLESFKNTVKAREWLVANIKGYGYKEASHFLRNIGLGKNIAILDRHILKNLKKAGVIKQIPKSLSRRTYLDIEQKMREFSKKIKIPLNHLDFVLWYKEAGDVFK